METGGVRNIAADLTAWTRLLGFGDHEDLRDADPDTLRYRVWHIPARLARHARQRVLKISPDWPWKDAFLTCWHRLCTLPAPARPARTTPAARKEAWPARSEPVRTRAPRAPRATQGPGKVVFMQPEAALVCAAGRGRGGGWRRRCWRGRPAAGC